MERNHFNDGESPSISGDSKMNDDLKTLHDIELICEKSVGDWVTILRGEDLVWLLREAGYGDKN